MPKPFSDTCHGSENNALTVEGPLDEACRFPHRLQIWKSILRKLLIKSWYISHFQFWFPIWALYCQFLKNFGWSWPLHYLQELQDGLQLPLAHDVGLEQHCNDFEWTYFKFFLVDEIINAPETLQWQVISPNTIFRHVVIISMHDWNSSRDLDKSNFEDRYDHLQVIMWDQNDPIESCWAWHYESTELKMCVLACLVMNSWPLLFQNLLKKPARHIQRSLHCKCNISATMAGITKWLGHTTHRSHCYNWFKFEDITPIGLDSGE